jgi:hypothetical protein
VGEQPERSSSASSFATVDGETGSRLARRASSSRPARRSRRTPRRRAAGCRACARLSSPFAGILAFGQQLGRDAAAEEAARAGERERPAVRARRRGRAARRRSSARVDRALEPASASGSSSRRPSITRSRAAVSGSSRSSSRCGRSPRPIAARVARQARCVPPAHAADGRDGADADPEIVVAEPVAEVVAERGDRGRRACCRSWRSRTSGSRRR